MSTLTSSMKPGLIIIVKFKKFNYYPLHLKSIFLSEWMSSYLNVFPYMQAYISSAQ